MSWFFADGSFWINGIHAFCRMLVHSLWLGLLLTISTGAVILITRRSASAVRYMLVNILFFMFLIACGVTFFDEWSNVYSAAERPLLANMLMVPSVFQDFGIDRLFSGIMQYCTDHSFAIVALWFVIFSFRCFRLRQAVSYMHRVKTAEHFETNAIWSERIKAFSESLKIKKAVRLLESGITKVPVVIGHLKPVIYIPVGLLANLPYEQVEAVLVHELAHIRRNDYLSNLIYNVAETVFFFNPALLWVTGVLRSEAEDSCDDIALANTSGKKQYIQALISFREHAMYGTEYATAFAGRKNHLLQRVTRIIHSRNKSLNLVERLFFVASMIILPAWLSTIPVKDGSAGTIDVLQIGDHAVEQAGEPVFSMVMTGQVNIPAAVSTSEKSVKKRSRHSSVNRQEENDEETASAEEVFDQVHQDKIEEQLDQVEQDRLQAERDREQAIADREQAERDREQAEVDRKQAMADREQAKKDAIIAMKQRLEGESERRHLEAENIRLYNSDDRAR